MLGSLVTVDANQQGESTASCESDEVVTGGGANIVETTNTVNPHTADGGGPSDTNPTAWEYFYSNPGPLQVGLQAHAICAKLVDAS
jgi:hypothetical protein